MASKRITRRALKCLLSYDPDTGGFTWLVDRRGHAKAGDCAGSENQGYIVIKLCGRKYMAHVLAWFYVHGRWPRHDIDHRDTVRHHNWIKNLRDVTRSVNLQNQTKAHPNNQSTGLLGVCAPVAGKYPAKIKTKGKQLHLGSFPTAEAAHQAYITAKRIHHEGNTL